MIETLKSELKLRPTYDELVGMIESQGDPNRPSIEKIIDRRATIFRNNQFGSQFDNVDFLGLKKQEEDKLKEEQRQTELKKAAAEKGTSLGTLNAHEAHQSGTSTPLTMDTASSMREMTVEELDRMTAGMVRDALAMEQRRHDERMVLARARASADLDDAHSQSLPVGVMDEEEEDMPPLINIGEGEEEEEFEDDPELIPDEQFTTTIGATQTRKHKETIDYSTKITKWQDKSVQEEDIRFQLFLRGIELTPEQEEEIAKLKVKGKGRNQTRKDYLIDYVDRFIQTGKWTDQVNDQLLQKRMVEWREMKKGKGKGSSSSSGIGGAIASGVKEIGGAALDAGKEAVKEAVVAGTRSAVMSLI